MKRSRPAEEGLARLNALRANSSRSNVLAAKAAEIAGDCEIRELAPRIHRGFALLP